DAVTLIPGSFDRTIEAIKILREAGLKVKINFTAMTLNFRELAAARTLTLSLGAEFNWSSQVQPGDDRSVIPLTFRLPAKEQMELQKQRVAEATAETGEFPPSGYKNDNWFCGAGKASFSITPYGDVEPCNTMRMYCGNVREQPFLEIWNTSPAFKR